MAPLLDSRTVAFLLYDLLHAEELAARPRYADFNREAFDAILETAAALAAEHYATHNKLNDTDEPRVENGKVVLNPAVGPAFQATADAGLLGVTLDNDDGGIQLPQVIAVAAYAWLDAANVATASYPLLTVGAANLIAEFGSPEQKAKWLPPMLSGHTAGTMALTEPDAGSSLSDIRTAAKPQPDGTYHITGTKIWISGGEQEITQNIHHLVLARIDGAPAGTKGISLFFVPKYLDNGAHNGVVLGGLIHKMGWRGTTSTLLNFGEKGPTVGWLIGEPHKGLSYMFHMMNEARIAVGRAASGMANAAYLYASEYARQRKQGRAPAAKDPNAPPVPIIEHADIRRMLLEAKANAEGALALILTSAKLVDDQHTAPTEAERAEAALLLEVLTPLAKTYPALGGQVAISNAMQIMGGYGYAREYPIEQFYRDNRLNQIHEGTNGIQALDLLGRKVMQQGGAAFKALMGRMRVTIDAAAQTPLAPHAKALGEACAAWGATTQKLGAAMMQDPNRALANATVYLDVAARVVQAWLWLQMGLAAQGKDDAFHQGKLACTRYWFGWELPRIYPDLALLERLDDTTLTASPDWL